MPNTDTEIYSAFNAGLTLHKPHEVYPRGGKCAPAFVLPAEAQLEIPDFSKAEKWLEEPTRRRGEFKFSTMESFIRYFNEQKEDTSRIFASVNDTGGNFKAILDFHSVDHPSWNEHTALATLVPTHEWKLWTASNKKPMNQTEFAQFLEENTDLFTSPTGADLLELIISLEGKNHADIKEAFKLQSGAIKINYTEEVVLKGVSANREGNIELPSILKVAIAPFEGVANYEVTARLRYRLHDRRLIFWYETSNAHLVIRAITADLVQLITKQTGIEPFRV